MSVKTERAEGRRSGKKLWILIPVLLAVLLAAAVLLWLRSAYVFAGGLYPRDSVYLDLRGKSLSENNYLRLKNELPGCEILWDVPIGGSTADCGSEALTLPSFSEKDMDRLAYFPALSSLDITAADVSPALFDALRAAYPTLSVRWSVPIGGGRYPSDTESVVLTDFDVSEVSRFDYFTALRSADARSCTCYDAILALQTVRIGGRQQINGGRVAVDLTVFIGGMGRAALACKAQCLAEEQNGADRAGGGQQEQKQLDHRVGIQAPHRSCPPFSLRSILYPCPQTTLR